MNKLNILTSSIIGLFFLFSNCLMAQDSDEIKKQFLKDLESEKVKDGCKIVVYVANAAANSACFVPEPTVSKVACAAAQIMNVGIVSDFADPNIPHPVIEASEIVCRLTYATGHASITYTFDFAKNQVEEIRRTWNWLNTLEGAVFFMKYISR